jgi:hypothetical protein
MYHGGAALVERQVLVHHGSGLKNARIEIERVTGNDADDPVSQRQIKRLRRASRHRVEREQCAPRPKRLNFNRDHERSRDSPAPSVGVHQKFLDLGAMRLIRGSRKIELDCANDIPTRPGNQQAPIPGGNLGKYLAAPKRFRVLMREGQHKTDARAGVNAGVEKSGQRIYVIRTDCVLPSLDPNFFIWGCGSHGCTNAITYRAGRFPHTNFEGPAST